VVLVDPNIAQPQRIWLVRSSVKDERREEKRRKAHEQLSVVVADVAPASSGQIADRMSALQLRATSPANLLNYTAPDAPVERPNVPTLSAEEVQLWAYEHLTRKELENVTQHRQAECDLRRRYLETTFTDLILDLQAQLNDLQQLQLIGDDDPEKHEKLQKRIQQLKARRDTRLAELDLMLRLSADLPDIVTSAIVVPSPVAIVESDDLSLKRGVPMRRDDEVERIAMEVAMRYERSRGWTPYDVSQDGEHYDIRSVAPDPPLPQRGRGDGGEGIRFIEVKGRAQSGAIVLTAPEVDKLRQLGDRAFLYIVTFCKGERPRLRIIQNPMAHLSPEALYRQVQYLVDEKDWQTTGEEVEI
jgi:hypothetical protein